MQQQLQQQIRYQDRSGSQHRVQRADVVREGSYKAKLGRHMTWGSKGWPCLPPPPLPLLLMVNCSPSALVFVFVLFMITFVPLTLPTTHPSHAGGQLCTLCSTSLLSTNSQDQNNAVEWIRYVIIRQTARGEPQYETRGEKEDQLGFIRMARWDLRMIFDVILGRSK